MADGEGVQMLEVAPYFLVEDVFETAEYYRDVLGFHFDRFYGDPPSFVIVSRDGVRIMLKHHAGATRQQADSSAPSASDAYVWVDDVRALASELRGRGATLITDPTDQDAYKGRDMHVRDCDGRVLCFGELLDD